jgi:hypothetical protein
MVMILLSPQSHWLPLFSSVEDLNKKAAIIPIKTVIEMEMHKIMQYDTA